MSTIIISQSNASRIQKAEELCSDLQIDPFDRTHVAKSENASSIGIKDIKEMMQKIFLKPLKSKEKAIIIEDAELLTNEAQNALLKVLEEPPRNTQIILCSTSIDTFLPTILSRCKVITISEEKEKIPKEEFTNTFLSLLSLKPNQALELAEKYHKNKDEATQFLENLIRTGQHILLEEVKENKTEQYITAKILKHMTKSHKNLKTTNINTRLELEHLFLNIHNS
jgi:DNA polymerase III gamma/tau subunit